MVLKSTALLVSLGLLASLGACAEELDAPVAFVEGAQRGGSAPRHEPQLNLSHVECTEDGKVEVHFVLLFAGDKQPGTLSFQYNEGESASVEPGANTGNVWHYTTYLKSGWIDVTGAEVKTADGKVVSLHNPGDYAGDYQCGEAEECSVKVEPKDLYCSDPGNPDEECGELGLVPSGTVNYEKGLAVAATQDAYVALVKTGVKGCEGGSAYRIYVNVSEGDKLESPLVWWENLQQYKQQDISHVTYCACPVTNGEGR